MEHETKYQEVVSRLRLAHGELLKLESEGKISNAIENPGLVGDYLTRMRLNCNLLFSFQNAYLDILNEATIATAKKRQDLYVQQIALKKSPSAANAHSSNMTRIDEANIEVIKNKLKQIKGEYTRFDGICIMLQSRMREFSDERKGL